MELRTYWKVLIRRWWLVLAPVLVVLVHTVVTYQSPPPTFQVVMRFAAGTTPAGLSVDYDRYYPWLASEYIANGLEDVAETGAFARAVAARLASQGVSADPNAIQAHVATDSAQSILVIYLNWPDAERARQVAEAIAEELTQNGSAYFPQLDDLDPAVTALDQPVAAPMPPSLRAQLMGPAIRLLVGLTAGIGLALLWHYLDPTVRERDELEELGVGVLGQIPRR